MEEYRPSTAPYAVVVDDNPVILLHAADILTDAGFSVFTSGGSDGAMEWLALHGEEIVLLFTNVEIPGRLNGFGLARQTANRWPQIAILVSSGKFEPGPEDMPSGSVFLPKPYGGGDMLEAVRQSLTLRRSAALKDFALVL